MSMTRLLTKKEVAAILQISEKPVERPSEKKLQAQRLSYRTLRFRPEAVAKFSEQTRMY